MDEIDLGKSPEKSAVVAEDSAKPKKYYPSITIDGVENADFEPGDIVGSFTGRVISVTENDDDSYSCRIEIHTMKCDDMDEESEDLEGKLNKMEKKKK